MLLASLSCVEVLTPSFGVLSQTRCAACQSLEAGGNGRMRHVSNNNGKLPGNVAALVSSPGARTGGQFSCAP